jgi:hypothetical protein
VNTSNASIKAIIFTIILFLFIVFISLFKGIYLYNIKIKNIYIKSLFLKIDNKIIIKLDNVNIKKIKNHSIDILDIYKNFLSTTKLLNIFEKIVINNLKYGNYTFDVIKLVKNKLFINSDFIKLQGKINEKITISYLKIPKFNLYLENATLYLNFKKEYILIKGNFFYTKNKIFLNAQLKKNNTIYFSMNAFKFNYLNFITLKNTQINGKANLDYYTLSLKSNISKTEVYFNNTIANFSNINLNINNHFITGNIQKANINKLLKFKNIKLNNIKIYYAFKNNFSNINIEKISSNIDNYKINSFKNKLVFKNKNNFNFIAKDANIVFNQNTQLTLKHILLNVFNQNISYTAKTSTLNSKYAILKSSEILGKLFDIKINKIKGKILGFNSELDQININIKKQTANIPHININDVNINNIKYKNKKLTLKSNTLFDEKIKTILYKLLKINIPLIQIGGTNEINSTIKLSDNFNSLTQITTNSALFKLFDYDLFIKKGDVNITNKSLNFFAKDSKLFLNKNLPLTFSGKGLINYNKQQLNLNGIIDFGFKNIIKLNNFNEDILVDFNKSTLTTKNSHIYIDFDHSSLIINQLKSLLTFTPFKLFVKNGLLLITFNKNSAITSYLLLKLPILYAHNNAPLIKKNIHIIDKIFLYLFSNNKTKIYNKNISIQIKDNSINANLNNIDINLYPLEQMLNKFSNNDFNYSIKLNTNNSNLIYKTHKFLSQSAAINYKQNISFHSTYKHSFLKGYTKRGYLLLEGQNFSNEELRAFLPTFDFFNLIDLDFITVKSPDDFYTGKIYINRAIIRELKSLNNIIAFINTVPSILSFSSPGFSSKGYKIKKGFINYLLYKKILYIKEAKINGDNLDFYAKGYIDFNKNYIFLKITANMKIKLKKIPIIGKGLSYLLFGKDGSIDIKMIAKGDINNPKVQKDIGKDILMSPFKLFKRAITLPFNLF